MTKKSQERSSRARVEVAQKLGYQIIPFLAAERQDVAKWLREDGEDEDARKIEENGQVLANHERPTKEELEAWDKECKARGVLRGAGGEGRPDEDYRILRFSK